MYYFYISPYVEFYSDVSRDDIDRFDSTCEYVDTVYLKRSDYKYLSSIFAKIHIVDSISRYPNYYGVFCYGSQKIYIDDFGGMCINDAKIWQNDTIAYWRYMLKKVAGYYNKFYAIEDLMLDKDVKNFGVPADFKCKPPITSNPKNPIKIKEGYQKIIFIER